MMTTALHHQSFGDGEPVLLIHGSHFADAFLPLVHGTDLCRHYRLIHYHRRGLGRSPKHEGPFSVADQARDALRLVQHLGIESLHVVGHSYGAVTAVQLAVEAPRLVHSLALLEPPLRDGSSPPISEDFAALTELYRAGRGDEALEAFGRVIGGPEWRSAVESALPDALAQAARDIATFFDVELPAIDDWAFNAAKAERITQPALFVLGGESGPLFEGPKELFCSLVPQTRIAVLPGLDHLLQIRDPRAVAEPIAAFLARHPLPTR